MEFVKKGSDFSRKVLRFIKGSDYNREVLKFVELSSQKVLGS